MTITKRMALALALGSVMALAVSSVAQATHVRPQGAAQFRVPMVIAYNACALPGNRTHGPALSFPSCAPPVQASDWLTVGTTDANTFAPQSNGSVSITVCPAGTTGTGACSTPAGMSVPDVRLAGSATDVRCRVGLSGGQGQCEGAALSDYTGEVEANAQIRITDHHNNATPGGTGDTATVIDVPFPVVVDCSANPAGGTATAIGGTCSVITRANAVVPGAVVPTKRANVEIGQVFVLDGGQDGLTASTTDNQDHFGRQGIFIP